MEPEEKWYRIGPSEEAGIRQFLVQDPDGYLVRLQMSLGHRTLEQEPNAAESDATRSAVTAACARISDTKDSGITMRYLCAVWRPPFKEQQPHRRP